MVMAMPEPRFTTHPLHEEPASLAVLVNQLVKHQLVVLYDEEKHRVVAYVPQDRAFAMRKAVEYGEMGELRAEIVELPERFAVAVTQDDFDTCNDNDNFIPDDNPIVYAVRTSLGGDLLGKDGVVTVSADEVTIYEDYTKRDLVATYSPAAKDKEAFAVYVKAVLSKEPWAGPGFEFDLVRDDV